jgi:hypothetical protein
VQEADPGVVAERLSHVAQASPRVVRAALSQRGMDDQRPVGLVDDHEDGCDAR